MKNILRKSILFVSAFILMTGFIIAKDGYNIKVKIAGIKNAKCFLANYYGDKQYLKDSVISDAQGVLTFSGKDSLPGGIYLVVTPNKNYFEIIITKNDQNFSIETDTSDFVGKMKIKGSEENQRFLGLG